MIYYLVFYRIYLICFTCFNKQINNTSQNYLMNNKTCIKLILLDYQIFKRIFDKYKKMFYSKHSFTRLFYLINHSINNYFCIVKLLRIFQILRSSTKTFIKMYYYEVQTLKYIKGLKDQDYFKKVPNIFECKKLK